MLHACLQSAVGVKSVGSSMHELTPQPLQAIHATQSLTLSLTSRVTPSLTLFALQAYPPHTPYSAITHRALDQEAEVPGAEPDTPPEPLSLAPR